MCLELCMPQKAHTHLPKIMPGILTSWKAAVQGIAMAEIVSSLPSSGGPYFWYELPS